MDDPTLALVKAVHRKEIERLEAAKRLEPPEPAPIPYTELPELPRDHELHREWNTYRRQVGAILEKGLEGLHVLIKGEAILGLYGRWEHAYIAALEKALRNELQPPFLIHRIRAQEPVFNLEKLETPWPLSRSPLAQTA